jgi:phosphate transport system substrate-binding protein
VRAAAAATAAVTAMLAATAAPVPARGAAAPAQPTITMSGQQITQALVADLAYFYRHSVRNAPRFSLTAGGTGPGIADVARGITDAALVSRGLQDSDPPGLVLTRLARSGVCLVSNRLNPVPTITRAQLQDLISGRVTTWDQIQGSARTDAIVPVALAAVTGASRVFDSVFVDDSTAVGWQPATLLQSTQARDYIEQTPAAFGYVDLAHTGPLHVIAFEGVTCSRETIRNGVYPAERPLGIVTRGRPRGALRQFLRWAHTSSIARRVIATRYVPD